MSDRLKALREQRGAIVTEMRAVQDKAVAEKRDMSDEELAKHGELFDKADRKRKEIEAEERTLEAERDDAAKRLQSEDARKEAEKRGDPAPADAELEERRMKAFRSYLAHGRGGMNADEVRDLQVAPDTSGGYLLAPQQFVAELIKFVDNAVLIRGLATKYSVNNNNGLGAPSLDNDPADFDWTTELLTGSADTTMSFGKRELRPHPMAKRIKVSKTLLQQSALPVEQIVMSRLGYKVGVTQEKAYMTGTGNSQPLGVFTASNDGISTGQDVSTGNTTTAITFDGLIEAKFKLKGQYQNTASWIFHRDAVKMITKLKDGDGQYLWRMSVRDGEPDTILGRPLYSSEYAPNTFTTGLYVGMFGDFRFYWIADCLNFAVQRLVELYAETNQDGFIGRYEGDGMPVLEEAFARVKLA